MTDEPKRKLPAVLDVPFEEALARFLQTDPAEVINAHQRVRQAQEDVEKHVRERRESIRRGARRSSGKFRL